MLLMLFISSRVLSESLLLLTPIKSSFNSISFEFSPLFFIFEIYSLNHININANILCLNFKMNVL